MRLAQVAALSVESLGLAAVVAGLLLFLTGYVLGSQTQAASALATAQASDGVHCPAAARAGRGEFEPLALDGSERKVKSVAFPTPAN